ncbi:MAG: UBP-type zinc finger domain-containing protein [Thermoleophilia bacterium]|nr:UBP-type zinc finger domain-containing protein [Thermoleophilia bacterium]
MAQECTHIESPHITYVTLPSGTLRCEECVKLGMSWVHLRMCTRCGHIGCCDNSAGRHATEHFRSTNHPVVKSAEPGEEWYWCYIDEVAFAMRQVD